MTTDDATTNEIKENVREMLACYHNKEYGFEGNWNVVEEDETLLSRFFELAKLARAYHLERESKDHAALVFSQRDLVNIAMKKIYDQDKWKSFTGTHDNRSGYECVYSETRQFPPVVGVYCLTPVFLGGVLNRDDERHVFSSVGVALDSNVQPDYAILSVMDVSVRLEAIRDRVRKSYELFFACLDDTKLKKAALCILGGGAFGLLFHRLCEGKDYVSDVWWHVVKPFVESKKTTVDFYLLGSEEEFDSTNKKLSSFDLGSAGLFPDNEPIKDRVSSVLFQNAWDPHSVVGNGHSADTSLDGFVGRHTLVAPLTFPGTNPMMRDARLVDGSEAKKDKHSHANARAFAWFLRDAFVPVYYDSAIDSLLPPNAYPKEEPHRLRDDHDMYVTTYESVRALLATKKFTFVKIEGDGHCFFRAVARALSDENSHLTVRHEAVRKVLESPELVDFVDEEWTRAMRGDEWADQYAVFGTAKALGVCIEVYKQRFDAKGNETEVFFARYRPDGDSKCSSDNTIVLLNTGGGDGTHFDLLIEKQNGDE
jgi:hypothetical protein